YDDLTLRYRTLGLLFGVPDRGTATNPIVPYRMAEEELPAGHPARETAGEGQDEETMENGEEGTTLATNMILRRWGGPFFRSMLTGWWRSWTRRRRQSDSILTALDAAIKAGVPFHPEGRVKDWMQTYGYEGQPVQVDSLLIWRKARHDEIQARRRALFTSGRACSKGAPRSG
ncbi:MAG: hypothetical protein ACKPKO_04840, partial [Candidatus Fonsibacter sp.]